MRQLSENQMNTARGTRNQRCIQQAHCIRMVMKKGLGVNEDYFFFGAAFLTGFFASGFFAAAFFAAAMCLPPPTGKGYKTH